MPGWSFHSPLARTAPGRDEVALVVEPERTRRHFKEQISLAPLGFLEAIRQKRGEHVADMTLEERVSLLDVDRCACLVDETEHVDAPLALIARVVGLDERNAERGKPRQELAANFVCKLRGNLLADWHGG